MPRISKAKHQMEKDEQSESIHQARGLLPPQKDVENSVSQDPAGSDVHLIQKSYFMIKVNTDTG